MRDALVDLVQENRLSVIKLNDAKCPMGACLAKHGYARWHGDAKPIGKWQITTAGWAFLETRTRQIGETR